MKPLQWKEGMTPEESKDVAYFERNMLVLGIACGGQAKGEKCGWYYDTDNNWDGWKRVISVFDGQCTFHIPDDFDTGNLKEIEPNWDGHTTKEKWIKFMTFCGCEVDLDE